MLLVLGSCRQADDVVAQLTPETGSGVPPIEDVGAPPLDASSDVSIERDAPPVTIDVDVPLPDAASDIVVTPPPPVDAMPPPPVDVMQPPTCSSTSPKIPIWRVDGGNSDAGANSEVCAGQLAAHTFTHALCACGDMNMNNAGLTTRSFDSTAADTTTVGAGAPIGVAGAYERTGTQNIGGSLIVAGTARPLVATGSIGITGDIRLAGVASFGPSLTVSRDAYFVSRVGYAGYVGVGRKLNVGPSGIVGLGTVTPMPVTSSFTVEDTCGCADKLDVARTELAGAAGSNDNAVYGIDPGSLSNVVTTANVTLLCGRFRFDSIGGPGAIQLTIKGRTAIFVDGSVAASDAFQLVIAPGAELDMFIRDNLSVAGMAKVGDTSRPSATRIYVGGTAGIALSSASMGSIGANIYAPNADVTITAAYIAGSVYGKNMNVTGGFINYDRAILNQGVKCEQPVNCDQCHTCNGGTACKDNTCTVCSRDEDCCLPLVCEMGVCQQLLH